MLKLKAHTESTKRRLELLLQSARSNGLRSVAAFAAAEALANTKSSFLQAADPRTGAAWRPRRFEPPWPILRKTGTLWADTTAYYEVDGSRAAIVVTVPPASDAYGYGYKHQFGYPMTRLPARPFAGLSAEGRKKVVAHAIGAGGLLKR